MFAFRILIDAFKVKARVSTNSFRVLSLISGDSHVVAGDLLIRVRGLTVDELKSLVEEMERVAARNASRNNVRVTRSMTNTRDASVNSMQFVTQSFSSPQPPTIDISSLFASQ